MSESGIPPAQIVDAGTEAAAVRMMLELGIDPREVAQMTMDARRRQAEAMRREQS